MKIQKEQWWNIFDRSFLDSKGSQFCGTERKKADKNK